jgi:phage N-6-adenine-methyltransferase
VLRVKGKQDWRTPDWLFNGLQNEFGLFYLDAAADAKNTKCVFYYTKKNSGLVNPWDDCRTFCNPPFSQMMLWVKKAIEEKELGRDSVMLAPANGYTTKWYALARQHCDTYLLSPRVAFLGPGTQPNGGTMALYFTLTGRADIRFLDVSSWRT